MRFSVIAVAGWAAIVAAQGQGGIDLPACATDCVTAATSGSNIGDCQLIDIECICKSSTFLSGIACCLAGRCDDADQKKATSEAIKFCGNAGVTGLPTAVSCTTGATSSASASASSSSAAPTTSQAATTTATSGAATSSAAAASSTASASSVKPSTTATAAGPASSTASAASTSTTSKSGAGALQNIAGVGAGVLGAVAAALL